MGRIIKRKKEEVVKKPKRELKRKSKMVSEVRSSKRAKSQTVPFQSSDSLVHIFKEFSDFLASTPIPTKSIQKKDKKKGKTQNITPLNTLKAKIAKTKRTPNIRKKHSTLPTPSPKSPSKNKRGKAKVPDDDSGISGNEMSEEETKTTSKKRKRKSKKDSEEDGKEEEIKSQQKNKKRKKVESTVTLYEKDPMFESKASLPFISTLAHSKLIIRAVIMKDHSMLENLIKDRKQICSLRVPRALETEKAAIEYAIENEDLASLKLLTNKSDWDKVKSGESLYAQMPDLLLEEEKTGRASRRMFGHHIKSVNIARGGKEGNKAFLLDSSNYSNYNFGQPYTKREVLHKLLESKCSIEFYKKASTTLFKKDDQDEYWDNDACGNVCEMMRNGDLEKAAYWIKEATKRGGFGFNKLHEDSLNLRKGEKEPFSIPIKMVSVGKMAMDNQRVTPLHCAAINPNPYYLAQLLNVNSSFNIQDTGHWTPAHYAALCSASATLKLLISRGGIGTLNSVTKDGDTPLHIAAKAGKAHNVKAILEAFGDVQASAGDDEDDEEEGGRKKPKGKSEPFFLCQLNKLKKTPFHVASEEGHLEVVKLLVQKGADPNIPMKNPKLEKMTPLILASKGGFLPVVKYLIEEVNVKKELVDRRKRTALTYAVINGHTHVASYLISQGAKVKVRDTSGNSLMHYAVAYGWYFTFKLLIEAGLTPNDDLNEWKIPPIAIAFMKGHMGLVAEILKIPGANIDAAVNDSEGSTLLMQTCKTKLSDTSFVSRVKTLLETYGANPNVKDHKGNTALHYLAYCEENTLEMRLREYKENLKVKEATKILLERGASPFEQNEDGESPFLLSVRLGTLNLFEAFFDYTNQLPNDFNNKNENCLHLMIPIILNMNKMDITPILNKASTAVVQPLKQLAKEFNSNGQTPLLLLLTLLKKNLSSYENDFRGKGSVMKKRAIPFLQFLLQKLSSDVLQEIKDENENFALHLGASLSMEVLKILIGFNKSNWDPVNKELQTPLGISILNGNFENSKLFINAGADVNFQVGKEKRHLLLIEGEKQRRNFALVHLLMKKGANVTEVDEKTGNSILHYLAANPELPFANDCLTFLVKKSYNLNIQNKRGRTALHLCANYRRGETDASYDFEDALIKAGASVNIRDVHGRIPLHYAFVKIGKHMESSFMDPLELVAILINSMKTNGFEAEVKLRDSFNSMPIHYAAMRGSTISASLLLNQLKMTANVEKVNDVNLEDGNGNTPFGLAVKHGHESMALYLLQLGGDYSKNLHPIPKIDDQSNNVDKWRWAHSINEENLNKSKEAEEKIVENIVKKDWHGLLYLIMEEMRGDGRGIGEAIEAALKTKRFKLTAKLVERASESELDLKESSMNLIHYLAVHSSWTNVGSSDKADFGVQKRIFDTFISKNVKLDESDKIYKTSPLTHGTINGNFGFCEELLNFDETNCEGVNIDQLGRSPFSGMFWNGGELGKEAKNFAKNLFRYQTTNANVLSKFPMCGGIYPGVRFENELNPKFASIYSPLIAEVIRGNYGNVKWLLNSAHFKIDVNLVDENGTTAMMHAVRQNDIKMVKLLLNPSYNPETDSKPWDLKSSKKSRNNSKIDMKAVDKKGQTVIDYLLHPFPSKITYHLSIVILTLLIENGASCNEKALEEAQNLKNNELHAAFSKHLKRSDRYVEGELNSKSNVDLFSPENDINSDAEQMTNQLLESMMKEEMNLKLWLRPDKLFESDGKKGRWNVLTDQDQFPFTTLLSHYDSTYGYYGLYNFYKMQLVEENVGKKLIVLLTRWGRVGEEGMHQKTPFPTLEDGIKEFLKIFKSKTGNSWDSVKTKTFEEMPKKYRLVNIDITNETLLRRRIQPDVKAMEESTISSPLPKNILEIVKKITGVHYVVPNSYENDSTQTNDFNISYDTLKEAEKLLGEIEMKVKERKKMNRNKKEEFDKLTMELINMSEQFYTWIPFNGFLSERLTPMLQPRDLEDKQQILFDLLQLEFANKILLAAQLHIQTRNPFHYIYKNLPVQLTPFESTDSLETQLLLQYIENTASKKPLVKGIYRVNRKEEEVTMKNLNFQNRWLLWHGTKGKHVLSILNKGLQVAPLGAEISGDLFGKGIYFADLFEKSENYCDWNDEDSFIFLCEVALGKVHPVYLRDNLEIMNKNKKMPNDCQSLKTADSRYSPDPGTTIIWNGVKIPLGKKIENKSLSDPSDYSQFGLNFNEYIVFNPEQICIRYLINFGQPPSEKLQREISTSINPILPVNNSNDDDSDRDSDHHDEQDISDE